MSENIRKLLLIGFGDINQRLSAIIKSERNVTATRRSEFSNDGICCRAGDAKDPVHMQSLLQDQPDQIVLTLSPSEYSEEGYRSTYLATAKTLVAVCDQLSMTPEVVFISSSSVYSENQGKWIDVQSECLPLKHNGQILLQAEQCLLDSHLKTTIVRFSGIYGPGRYRLIKNSISETLEKPEAIHWTNRIHADDCAGVIAHLLDTDFKQRTQIYLASDCCPVPSHIVKSYIRSLATEETLSEPEVDLKRFEHLPATGKRCNNRHLLESGYQFKYPSYKEGFPAIFSAYMNS